MAKKTDYLTEDSFIPSDQKYLCISFLTDKENKTTLCAIKIRGVFSSYELACEHAKKIQDIDPYFNVFVGEMGKWLPFDPLPDSEAVKSSEYANEQLNNLMKGYLENQEKAKIFHEQRKTEMMRQNILDNLGAKNTNCEEIKNKLKKSLNVDEKVDLENKLKQADEQIKKMEDKKKELDDKLEKISKELKSYNNEKAPPKVIEY
jgi:hypothetical protein